MFRYILFCSLLVAVAQEAKLYNPNANAETDLKAALVKAKNENKFVLIQAGGN